MHLANLLDPRIRIDDPRRSLAPVLHRVDRHETQTAADLFLSARTNPDDLVRLAYRELEAQTDRQFAALTDPAGHYRITVVSTGQCVPYDDANDLIASVLSTRVLEVTNAEADRSHPLLAGGPGGAYARFRAVHDLIGHAATGYGFDPDGEYSAWLVQRDTYTGLARWAAATELHGEISALWATGQFADHRALLLDWNAVEHD